MIRYFIGPFRLKMALIGLIMPILPSAQTIWSANFKNAPEGPYELARAKTDFGPFIQYINVPTGRARIKMDAQTGKKVLEVKYPKGCVGSEACAIQVRSSFSAREMAWMRYKVRFDSGFVWNKGGKLPGLCGGKCNTGCVGVTGEDGWSARIMWRENGNMEQYLYYPDKQNGCGAEMLWNSPSLTTERWYDVISQVVLNTPVALGGTGKEDGILRVWLDGKMILEKTNLRYRDIASVKLDAFYFSTFYGGDSSDWGPPHDTYVSFMDIIVTATDPRLPLTNHKPRLILKNDATTKSSNHLRTWSLNGRNKKSIINLK